MISNGTIYNYISVQIVDFLSSSRCCQRFCGSFQLSERLYIKHYGNLLDLRTRFYMCDGIKIAVVHKKECLHYIASTTHIELPTEVRKHLFLLHKYSSFIGSHSEMQISPDFFSPCHIKPVVQPHRFSLGPLKQSMARQNHIGQKHGLNINQLIDYKADILQSIKMNRVLIVDGDSRMEKSLGIPMFLIENSAVARSHCKIICVEREQLLAIYNSEKLSMYIGDKVGDTIAFQVHLQSRISETSNLIYTTAGFLLRVLMGQKIIDSFRHISHVIVNDVQLHDALTDVLLCELKEALKFHPNLKIILLSNSQQNDVFLKYFGEGAELKLSCHLEPVNIIYLEEIVDIIEKERKHYPRSYAYSDVSVAFEHFHNQFVDHDKALDDYNNTGSEQSFEKFLYLVHNECISVDYKHSQYGYTALMIALKFDLKNHAQQLCKLGADPFLLNDKDMRKLSEYIENDKEILRNPSFNNLQNPLKGNRNFLDYTLITDIIRMLTTKCEWKTGHILVIMSTYEELIRMDFHILKHKLVGNLPNKISIHILHSNIEKDQLERLIYSKCTKIVLATDIVQTMGFIDSFSYVIDTARTQRTVYNKETMCEEVIYEWLSRENLDNRSKLAGRITGIHGTCFRLIPFAAFEKVTNFHTPELVNIQLDRICLTVKLLAQHQMIAEYFQNTIVQPPFINIYHAVERLKKMDILDSFEDITWLGCRIIDIPVECHLAKLLVFAILLQCLDPILTIVSFLCCADPLELSNNCAMPLKSNSQKVRYKIKQERKRLAEGTFSDHLMYIRLYQEWQNQIRDDNHEMALVDEYHFVINGLLEKVCGIRTLLVGALRSSQLIHNQGYLSMHFINLKSNCWPVIKAAFIGGLYPRICVVDKTTWQIKSPKKTELIIDPNSVLRELPLEPLHVSAKNFNSPWIVYGKELSTMGCNSISYCSLVAPVGIVLFAGPTKIHPTNIGKCDPESRGSQSNSQETNCDFTIDDWIWFNMSFSDAQLVLKTRQHFYSLYLDYLQHCGSMEKWRRSNILLIQNPRFFDAIERILMIEDVSYGFKQPENIGLRPKAVPSKCIASLNAVNSWNCGEDMMINDPVRNDNLLKNWNLHYITDTLEKTHLNVASFCVEKQFFMVYLSEANNVLRKYSHEWMKNSVANIVEPHLKPDKLIFVIIYHKNPDIFSTISVAKRNYGEFVLQDCFRNKIPIYELLNICLKYKVCIPSFNEKRVAFEIDSKIGNIILDLFSHRNNWLHNI